MSFADRVIRWQQSHGRRDLPWQGTRDAYRIWVSEIMLQQTQVAAVIPYYTRFLQRFPDVFALASSPAPDVMAAWAGLGYYSRARNLHRCAQTVVERYEGRFPATVDALAELPGIGRSTAAAIAAFAFGERAAILDGNVKRVFARHFGVEGYPGAAAVERQLWSIAEQELPASGIESYTQGLMDLGATLVRAGAPALRRLPRCSHLRRQGAGADRRAAGATARKGTAGAPRDRRDRARRPRSAAAGDPPPDRHLGRAREPSGVRCRGGRRATDVGDRRAVRAAGRPERTPARAAARVLALQPRDASEAGGRSARAGGRGLRRRNGSSPTHFRTPRCPRR